MDRHGQQGGDCGGREGVRGLNANGKYTTKILKEVFILKHNSSHNLEAIY